jgi:hypothetical protein
MFKAQTPIRERGRAVHLVGATAGAVRSALAPYQTRTCTRCGRHTTFVLDDPAGGWYACIECGRYA